MHCHKGACHAPTTLERYNAIAQLCCYKLWPLSLHSVTLVADATVTRAWLAPPAQTSSYKSAPATAPGCVLPLLLLLLREPLLHSAAVALRPADTADLSHGQQRRPKWQHSSTQPRHAMGKANKQQWNRKGLHPNRAPLGVKSKGRAVQVGRRKGGEELERMRVHARL
jgi:hypothetical protein